MGFDRYETSLGLCEQLANDLIFPIYKSGPPVVTRQSACETEDLEFTVINDDAGDETAGS